MIAALRRRLVALFWARWYRTGGLRTWLHEPVVRRAVNARVTGDENVWPMEWLRERYAPEPFARGLSLGCGEGALERDVVGKNICTEIVGCDLSTEALERATAAAREAGLENVAYRHADMNRLDLEPEAYDVVFFHQSLHHVESLETCLDQVRRALRPGGLLVLDEYVGPSRGDWTRDHLVHAEAAYARLPESLKRRGRLDLPVDWRDPSEAVRSADILPELERRFDVRERRDYGGNLLALVHPFLRPDRLQEPEGERALRALLAAEDDLLARGEASYYAVVVAERGGDVSRNGVSSLPQTSAAPGERRGKLP